PGDGESRGHISGARLQGTRHAARCSLQHRSDSRAVRPARRPSRPRTPRRAARSRRVPHVLRAGRASARRARGRAAALVLVRARGRRVPGRRRRRLDVCDGLLGTGDEPAASAVDATGAGRARGRARRGGAGGLGLARTPRERDYLAAIDAYYKDDAATDPKTRLQDSTTGTGSAVDLFRPDGGSTGMGVEYYVDLFGYNADSTVFVYDALAGTPTGSVRPRFQGRRITVRVPHALLGNDDGFLNAATVVGSESEPTDIAPENGHVRVGGASPAPRAGVSAARVGGQAHRGWRWGN